MKRFTLPLAFVSLCPALLPAPAGSPGAGVAHASVPLCAGGAMRPLLLCRYGLESHGLRPRTLTHNTSRQEEESSLSHQPVIDQPLIETKGGKP